MNSLFERSELIFGQMGVSRLQQSHVLVVGVGGVGGYVAEALARAGVGQLTLVDHDVVSPSNINRQIIALNSTCDLPKVDVMAQRILDINPACQVHQLNSFLEPDDMPELLAQSFDYVVDAIDSLNCKVALVKQSVLLGHCIISSMGAGRRFDVSKIVLSRLDKTHTCALARNMRQRLKKDRIGKEVTVVFSTELPLPNGPMESIEGARGRVVNGTASYMPGMFGLMIAGHVITELSGILKD